MKKIILLGILFSSLLIACKKNDTPTALPTTPSDSTLNTNVKIIDSTKLILNPDTTFLNQGKYEFAFSGNAPDLKIGDVIVGATNGGYIRKVNSVDKQSNKIVLLTEQGNMEDVFQNAHFDFSIGTEGLKNARVMAEQSFDISGIELYREGPLTINLGKGLIKVGGDWNFDFKYKNSKVESFVMECKNASFNGQFDFDVTADNAIDIVDKTVVLKRVAKYYTKWIIAGTVPVPIVVYMEIELRGKISASIHSKVDETFSINTNSNLNLGISYKNSQWQTIFNRTSSSSVAVTKFSENVKAKLELGLIPYVSFRLYRVVGPYASFGLRELVEGNATVPANDWDFYAGAWLQTIVGARAGILSKSVVDKNMEWNTDTISYKTPDKLEKISGDNQTGNAGEYLIQPLKVRVLDSKGASQSKVQVSFKVTAGGGSVETASMLTDQDGYAQTRWRLGTQNVIQTVDVKVKKADGTLINESSLEFAASTGQGQSTVLTTTPVTPITTTTAFSGGNITNNGGAAITARGVCWSTSQNPTIANSKTNNGSGNGSFTSNITGLTPNTTYYVRAYATNNIGTAYGNQLTFTTPHTVPINDTLALLRSKTWILQEPVPLIVHGWYAPPPTNWCPNNIVTIWEVNSATLEFKLQGIETIVIESKTGTSYTPHLDSNCTPVAGTPLVYPFSMKDSCKIFVSNILGRGSISGINCFKEHNLNGAYYSPAGIAAGQNNTIAFLSENRLEIFDELYKLNFIFVAQ